MTDSESRIQNLENTVHSIDKRQESFETFTKVTIQRLEEGIRSNNERMDKMDERMDRLESKMDSQFQSLSNQFHNAMIAGGIGLATILAGMVGVVVALIIALKP